MPGIYLSDDRVQQLNGDLFEKTGQQMLGDAFEQQATAALPDMVRQAQQDEAQRQQAIDAANQQAQRDSLADQFTAAAPQIAADHIATLTQADPDLTAHLGGGPAAPPVAPPADAVPSPTDPVTAPFSSYTAPTPDAPVTAPMSNPAATQQSIVPAVTPTTAGLSGGGGASGQVGARGQQILSSAADTASWLGADGQKALQAILVTEGGLAGARGDGGQSAGPLQFYSGGQLANFAAQNGMTQSQAMAYVEQNPEAAVSWAIGTPDAPGYLGKAILAGQKQGLSGADLATYAQQHGQVSVSPERAGANWNALFAGGKDTISGIASAVGGAVDSVRNFAGNLVPNQFGDSSLTSGEAAAACGPAAAVAFARANGRNPTLREAVDMARSVGFTEGGGMNGIANQKALLDKMGIASTLDTSPSWSKIAADAAAGNPVTISTPNHYFVADGFDPQTGKYHVGASGTAFKAGSDWMTPEQITQLGGGINGALFADHPISPTPSVAVADRQSQAPVQSALSQLGVTDQPAASSNPLDLFKQKIGDAFSEILAPLQNMFGGTANAVQGAAQGAVQGVTNAVSNAPNPLDLTSGPLAAVNQRVTQRLGEGGLNPGDILQVQPDLAGQLAQAITNASPAQTAATQATGIDPLLPFRNSGLNLPSAEQLNPQGIPVMTGLTSSGIMAGEGIAGGALAGAGNPLSFVVDPQGQLGSGLMHAVGDVFGGAGHMAAPVATDVADAAGRVVGGAEAAQINPQFATGLAGAAAGGGTAYQTTDPNDPMRWPKIAAAAVGGGLAGYGAAGAVENALAGEGKLLDFNKPQLGLKANDPVTGPELFTAYHTNNVISGLATMTHVAVNSILAPAWSMATRTAADLAGLKLDRVAGAGTGFASGLADSGAAFARSMLDYFSNVDSVANRIQNPVGSGLMQAQGIPGSLHGAFQSAAQMIIERTEVGRMAGEEASQLGLAGTKWADYVANMLANPTDKIAEAAQATAERAVLRGDLGTLAAKTQELAKVPVIGNTLFPVVKIAANSLAQGIEASPLGLAGTALDVARAATPLGKLLGEGPYGGAAGFAGNDIVAPLSERLTNNIAGTALTAWLANKALDGSITGAGPSDSVKRAEMVAKGWQANSVYVPGRGYVDTHIFGKLAVPLSMAGEYADAVNYGGPHSTKTSDPQVIAGNLSQQLGAYLEDQSAMRQLGQLWEAFHKPGASPSSGPVNALAMTLGGFVPESALLKGIATSQDPLVRKADPSNIGQALSMNLPGLRETVPPKLDVAGNTEPNPQSGFGVFAPRTGVVTAASQDPSLAVLSAAGMAMPKPPTSIQLAKAGAGYPAMSVDLTPAEQTQYQQARSQALQQLGVTEYAADPSWSTMDQAAQRKALNPLVRQADAIAAQQIAAQIPQDQLEARIGAHATRAASGKTTTPGIVQGPGSPLSLTPVPIPSR